MGGNNTDGLGREIMSKVQAESGDAPKRDANGLVYDQSGDLVIEHPNTRWVGTGRTVYASDRGAATTRFASLNLRMPSDKGEPIKQYKPFNLQAGLVAYRSPVFR